MRIGTWNIDARWGEQHEAFLQRHCCDVWLLTEVPPKAVHPPGTIAGYHAHLSEEVAVTGQHWAAVLTQKPSSPVNTYLPASVASVADGITFCSSVLPWRTCNGYPPHPWVGNDFTEMAVNAIESLEQALPKSGLVWGGDWNQNLAGGDEAVGCYAGRDALNLAVQRLRLRVTTAELPHQNPKCHTIDHIAIPQHWQSLPAEHISAVGLCTHDAYIVEVIRK